MRNARAERASITIDAPIEVVWSVFTDVERWPTWASSFTSVELVDGPMVSAPRHASASRGCRRSSGKSRSGSRADRGRAPSLHAGLLFNRLLRPNADYALDIHTRTTGFNGTTFNLAPDVRAMAELFPIDQIFDHPAYPTLLANAFINVGIPAITSEMHPTRRTCSNCAITPAGGVGRSPVT